MVCYYDKLKALLRKHKLSEVKFRKLVQMPEADRWNMEVGKFMSIETMFKICALFDCDIPDILDLVEIPGESEKIKIEYIKKENTQVQDDTAKGYIKDVQ